MLTKVVANVRRRKNSKLNERKDSGAVGTMVGKGGSGN